MCQFHEDFVFKGHKNIVAKKSYFIAPKCYLDILEGENIQTGIIEESIHCSLKGITEPGINLKIQDIMHQEEVEKIEAYEILFIRFCEGLTEKFILNPQEDNIHKVMFEFKGNKVSTRDQFIREVSF